MIDREMRRQEIAAMMTSVQPHQRIIVAHDKPSFDDNDMRFYNRTAETIGGVKIGITASHTYQEREGRVTVGAALHSFLKREHPHLKVFIDGKFNDIPAQMAGAACGVAQSKAWGFTIHTTNTSDALRAALDNCGSSLVVGVTVLTSMTDDDALIHYGHHAGRAVMVRAHQFASIGGRAIVCSPKELRLLARIPILKITPGIRDSDALPDDQARTATAYDAILDGADYLVVGRPITGAKDPADAAERIATQIEDALMQRPLLE